MFPPLVSSLHWFFTSWSVLFAQQSLWSVTLMSSILALESVMKAGAWKQKKDDVRWKYIDSLHSYYIMSFSSGTAQKFSVVREHKLTFYCLRRIVFPLRIEENGSQKTAKVLLQQYFVWEKPKSSERGREKNGEKNKWWKIRWFIDSKFAHPSAPTCGFEWRRNKMRQHEDIESNSHSEQTPGTEQRFLSWATDVTDQRS